MAVPSRLVCPGVAFGTAAENPLVSHDLCRHHYRATITHCSECGRRMCDACGPALCPDCTLGAREAAALVRERRRSRLELRRAGIALRPERGDPVILREGPLRLALPVVGAVVTALVVAALSAEVEILWGIDAALAALLCAVLVGMCVRFLLGGVSRTAGLVAAGVCLVAGALGSSWAGGSVAADPGPGLGAVNAWIPAHGAVAPALYVVAALLAYTAAAGHRPA